MLLFKVKKVGHVLTTYNVVGIKPLSPNWSPGLLYLIIEILLRTSLPTATHIEPLNTEITGAH